MTAWSLSFGWNWLLVPVAIWFLRGVLVALYRPRVRIISFREASVQARPTTCFHCIKGAYESFLVDIERQRLLPPWLMCRETWLVTGNTCIREGDGRSEDDVLGHKIGGALRVAVARQAETEELLK